MNSNFEAHGSNRVVIDSPSTIWVLCVEAARADYDGHSGARKLKPVRQPRHIWQLRDNRCQSENCFRLLSLANSLYPYTANSSFKRDFRPLCRALEWTCPPINLKRLSRKCPGKKQRHDSCSAGISAEGWIDRRCIVSRCTDIGEGGLELTFYGVQLSA